MGSSHSKNLSKKFESSKYLAQLQNQRLDRDSILSLAKVEAAASNSNVTIDHHHNHSRWRQSQSHNLSQCQCCQQQQQQQHFVGSGAGGKQRLRQSELDGLYYSPSTPSPPLPLQLPLPLPSSQLQSQSRHSKQQQQQLFPSFTRQNYYDVPPCCRRKPPPPPPPPAKAAALPQQPMLQQQPQPQKQQPKQQKLRLQQIQQLREKKQRSRQLRQEFEQEEEAGVEASEEVKPNHYHPYYISAPLATTDRDHHHSDRHHHHHQAAAAATTTTDHPLFGFDQIFLMNENNHHHHQHHHRRLHTSATTSTATNSTISSSVANPNDMTTVAAATTTKKPIDHFEQMSNQPRYQQGLAYTYEQRKENGLIGLLPPAIQEQDLQVKAVINFIDHCQDELGKYIYLRHLKDYNERLFYRTLTKNVEKLMPLVYTPTVGLGCQKFSEIYMRPRGLFISIHEAGYIDSVLDNWHEKDVRVIVVTDGERILGLGDLGANGMGISIGKLSLYTALAGIPPQNVLPITLDVGTNNEQLLQDPFYIGLRQKRIRGEQYEALIDEFMKSVVERWGRSCLIQFEDFGNSTAFNLLERYRNHYCTFNDDIQGTASVCVSGLISSAKLIGKRLRDCSFLFYGAGEANLGTANLLVMAMVEEGVTETEALKSIWLVDSKGLVVKSRKDLNSHKLTYAQDSAEIKDLEEIVDQIKPACIIGASAQGSAFTESICKKMAQFNERPIIFALSNPTSKAECTANQAYRWTDGRCVFASGSPFDPVEFEGKTYITGQGNNAYIFPGVGLAAIAAHVHTIPEETFLVAARALSDQLTSSDTSVGLIYPKLSKIREVTLQVAMRVLEYFYAERLATYRPEPIDKLSFLRGLQFDGSYDDSSSN